MDTNLTFKKEQYELMLTALDLSDSEEVILNGNKDNAQSLFFRLIYGASKTINIISEKLELYNTEKIIGALKTAIKRGVKVQILLDGKIDSNNDFLTYCMGNELCTIKTTDDKLKFHILTRDGVAYRYCPTIGMHNAIASFNGSTIATNANKSVFGASYSAYSNYKN